MFVLFSDANMQVKLCRLVFPSVNKPERQQQISNKLAASVYSIVFQVGQRNTKGFLFFKKIHKEEKLYQEWSSRAAEFLRFLLLCCWNRSVSLS